MNPPQKLVLNPTLVAEIQVKYRLRGELAQVYQCSQRQKPALFQALGKLQQEIPEAFKETLKEAGLLISPDDQPQMAVFRVGLSSGVQAEVDINLLDWILNPALWIQRPQTAWPEPLQPLADDLFFFDQTQTIVWVDDPRYPGLWPYWPEGDSLPWLEQVMAHPERLQMLPVPLAEGWIQAGILLQRDTDYLAAQTARIQGAQSQLQTQGVAVLRQLLPPLIVQALRNLYRQFKAEGYLTYQKNHRLERQVFYNEPTTRYIQAQSWQTINAVVAPLYQTLVPSYTYVSYYAKTGLAAHRDRPQCEWNVSIPVDYAPGEQMGHWPLQIKTEAGVQAADLDFGDAVIYSGTRHLHWRDPLPTGHRATVCLFHFVYPEFQGVKSEMNTWGY